MSIVWQLNSSATTIEMSEMEKGKEKMRLVDVKRFEFLIVIKPIVKVFVGANMHRKIHKTTSDLNYVVRSL